MSFIVLFLQEKFGDFWPFIASNFLIETQKDLYEVSKIPYLDTGSILPVLFFFFFSVNDFVAFVSQWIY